MECVAVHSASMRSTESFPHPISQLPIKCTVVRWSHPIWYHIPYEITSHMRSHPIWYHIPYDTCTVFRWWHPIWHISQVPIKCTVSSGSRTHIWPKAHIWPKVHIWQQMCTSDQMCYLLWIDTEEFEFLDLVDVGNVAISVTCNIQWNIQTFPKVSSLLNVLHQAALEFTVVECVAVRWNGIYHRMKHSQKSETFPNVSSLPNVLLQAALELTVVAVCCSVLQCVAVCCSVLQYVAVCCSVLQCVLQCVAVCCSVCCSVLQCLL